MDKMASRRHRDVGGAMVVSAIDLCPTRIVFRISCGLRSDCECNDRIYGLLFLQGASQREALEGCLVGG